MGYKCSFKQTLVHALNVQHLSMKYTPFVCWSLYYKHKGSTKKDSTIKLDFYQIFLITNLTSIFQCLHYICCGMEYVSFNITEASFPWVSCNKCRNKFVIIHTRDPAR